MRKIILIIILTFSIKSQSQDLWTLTDCVNRALKENISIKQSELDYLDSEISRKTAIGNFLPNLNIGSSHSWNVGLNQNITTGLLENITTQFSSMNLNMNVDILNGLKNIKQLHLANLSILANQYQLADMKENISLLVANSFLQILFNKEILKVQELQFEISKEELQRAIELVRSGVIPKGDLYEFEANLTSVEKSVIDAKNSLKLAKIALAQLLLIDDYENFDIVDVDYKLRISNILDKSPDEIFSYAVENKNEIKIAETNLEIAKKSLEFNKSFLQPRLSAFYSLSTRIAYSDRLIGSGDFNLVPVGVVENTNERVLAPVQATKIVPPKSFSDQFDINKGQNYGLSLSIPILNGFSVRSNVNRSKINVQRSENLLFQRKLDLENTINQAYSDAYGSLKAYEASKKSLDSRKLSFEYAKEKLNIGVLNPYEYSQVKQRFESAQSDLIRSKFDLIFKLKVLEFYFGVPVKID
ncbi:MAG: TolC family protein [Bacteroidota bacterium]|nr:TolC family protein [Bacteroidota bacterium]MEC8175539.1 TolC family protein [Bacteroidota bacterium]MEC8602020.1 TolC family protein [Bacteroidota bacterium]